MSCRRIDRLYSTLLATPRRHHRRRRGIHSRIAAGQSGAVAQAATASPTDQPHLLLIHPMLLRDGQRFDQVPHGGLQVRCPPGPVTRRIRASCGAIPRSVSSSRARIFF